jgi:hypothetical protein
MPKKIPKIFDIHLIYGILCKTRKLNGGRAMKSRKNTGGLHSTVNRELSAAATLVLSPRVTSTLHVPKNAHLEKQSQS